MGMWVIVAAIVVCSIIVGGSIETIGKVKKINKQNDIANSMSLRLKVPVSVDREEEDINCHELFYFVNANTKLYARVTNDNYEYLKDVLYKELHIILGSEDTYKSAV